VSVWHLLSIDATKYTGNEVYMQRSIHATNAIQTPLPIIIELRPSRRRIPQQLAHSTQLLVHLGQKMRSGHCNYQVPSTNFHYHPQHTNRETLQCALVFYFFFLSSCVTIISVTTWSSGRRTNTPKRNCFPTRRVESTGVTRAEGHFEFVWKCCV
jgi:hypothetical protein